MKTPILLLVWIVVAAGVGCSERAPPAATAAHDETHADDALSGHEVTFEAADGQRWSTDEPLRAAMSRIRSAVETAASAERSGALTAADRKRLAAAVRDDVAYMVANCKLEPDADAALHVLIGRMTSAASALETDQPAQSALASLAAVLRDYGAGFDHPGWPVD